MKFPEHLKKIRRDLHPLFLPRPDGSNTCHIDLSLENRELDQVDLSHTRGLDQFVFGKIKEKGATYGFGGYMEDRAVYRRSPHFAPPTGPARSVHLGVDIWVSAKTPVFLPLEGRVHSFRVNEAHADYGPTIIMEHQVQGLPFFTLYGHLSPDSLHGLFEGKMVKKGAAFCRVGNFPSNGDWPPHLHFQLITDMQGKHGDYPGVCIPEETEIYRRLCPDPSVFFSELGH